MFSDRPTDLAVGRGSSLPPTPVLDVSETIPSLPRPARLNKQITRDVYVWIKIRHATSAFTPPPATPHPSAPTPCRFQTTLSLRCTPDCTVAFQTLSFARLWAPYPSRPDVELGRTRPKRIARRNVVMDVLRRRRWRVQGRVRCLHAPPKDVHVTWTSPERPLLPQGDVPAASDLPRKPRNAHQTLLLSMRRRVLRRFLPFLFRCRAST